MRLIVKEIIEVNECISYILICPSSEQICTMNLIEPANPPEHLQLSQTTTANFAVCSTRLLLQPTTATTPVTSASSPFNSFIYLPVQMFAALRLHAYNVDFSRAFVRISLKLEIENVAATQYG